MSKEKDYQILLQQYNLAVVKAKDLQEQLSTKLEQWQKREDNFNITIKLTRELCESILAKSPSQNTLGKGKSWDSLEINEMIRLTSKALKEYNESRTELMKDIANRSEEKSHRIEELEEEVLYYKNGGIIQNIEEEQNDFEEFEEELSNSEPSSDNKSQGEKEKNEDNTKPDMNNLSNLFSSSTKKTSSSGMEDLFASKKKEKADTSKLSPGMQKKAEEGKITVEKANQIKKDLGNGRVAIEYEDEDEEIIEGEKTGELHKKNIKNNFTAKITQKSMKSYHSPKANLKKKKEREKIQDEVYGDKLKEMVSKISDDNWLILKVIGETGKSRVVELTGTIVDEFNNAGKVINARSIVNKISDLHNIGAVLKQVILTPMSSSMAIVSLTAEGRILYKKKYGKEPVDSEIEKIIAEHSTPEHGYGILQCAEIIQDIKVDKKPIYETVDIWHRDKPIEIKTADGKSNILYIPDIKCVDKNNSVLYIEYELDHHNPNDFNAKCNKMILAGMNRISFITPNVSTAQGICNNLKKWIETKGSSNIIRHSVLRVTTVKSLVGHDIRRDSEWLYTMRPGKDSDFNKNF